MKRHKILFLFLLVQILWICSGCGSSENMETVPETAAAAQVPIGADEDFAVAEAATEETAAGGTAAENVIGTFEELEDNHTAIFSFDGAETAFYFDEPAVQSILFDAVIGSSYTLSYDYDDTLGYIIYRISE